MAKSRYPEIIYVLGDEEPVTFKRIDSNKWGQYNSGGEGIWIDEAIQDKEAVRTVFHEYKHSFLYRTVDPDEKLSQETVCRLFETALVDIVRNNWNWLELLQEDLDA